MCFGVIHWSHGSCRGVKTREIERERERETDRQTDGQTDREIQKSKLDLYGSDNGLQRSSAWLFMLCQNLLSSFWPNPSALFVLAPKSGLIDVVNSKIQKFSASFYYWYFFSSAFPEKMVLLKCPTEIKLFYPQKMLHKYNAVITLWWDFYALCRPIYCCTK